MAKNVFFTGIYTDINIKSTLIEKGFDKMSSEIPSVFYLANAGIYLTDGKTGILVDGLFDSYEGFDPLPQSIEDAVMKKQAPFESLTALLFTHTHTDHYSDRKVSAFLKQYPETTLLLPDSQIFPGLCPIPCRHLLDKGKTVPHTALFLEYSGQNFFFSGDSDPVYLNRNMPQEILSACRSHIHMAFVNPFFFFLTPGRKFLDNLDPEVIFVYHMPIQVQDSLRYHEILQHGLSKYTIKTATPLLQFMYKLQ